MKKYILELLIMFILAHMMQSSIIAADLTSIKPVGNQNLIIFNDAPHWESVAQYMLSGGISVKNAYLGVISNGLYKALDSALEKPSYMIITSAHLYNNLRILHRLWIDFTSDTSILDLQKNYWIFKQFQSGELERAFNIYANIQMYQACSKAVKILIDRLEEAAQELIKTPGFKVDDLISPYQDADSFPELKVVVGKNSIKTWLEDPVRREMIEAWYTGFCAFNALYEKVQSSWNMYLAHDMDVGADISSFYAFIPKKGFSEDFLDEKYLESIDKGVFTEQDAGPFKSTEIMIRQCNEDAKAIAFDFSKNINIGKKFAPDAYGATLAHLISKSFISSQDIKKEYAEYAPMLVQSWNILLEGHGSQDADTAGMQSKSFSALLQNISLWMQVQSFTYFSCYPAGSKLQTLFQDPFTQGKLIENTFPVIATGSTLAMVWAYRAYDQISIPPFPKEAKFSLSSSGRLYNPYSVADTTFEKFFNNVQNKNYASAVNAIVVPFLEEKEGSVAVKLDKTSNFGLIKLPHTDRFIPVDLATMVEPGKDDIKKKIESGVFSISKTYVEIAAAQKGFFSISADKTPLIQLLYNDIRVGCRISSVKEWQILPLSTASSLYHLIAVDAGSATFSQVLKAFTGIKNQSASLYFLIDNLWCKDDVSVSGSLPDLILKNVLIFMNHKDDKDTNIGAYYSGEKPKHGFMYMKDKHLYRGSVIIESSADGASAALDDTKKDSYEKFYKALVQKMEEQLASSGLQFVDRTSLMRIEQNSDAAIRVKNLLKQAAQSADLLLNRVEMAS